MTRARLLGGLLALILLVCGAVIFLDQRGAFGDRDAASVSTPALQGDPPPASTSSVDGYGDLK
ncbi:hypothetical protein [Deinococcus hopiensis]|uniref:Uncharacterized protein n=1 Tax=Deinococcus hopiensis KR-140 TaxID=695939 RepID=A0A1W1VRP2_9DEIO|nr:hypothetical protein [Deinococcus hopiensis]SMB96029.1 hypothetical protein SAMN00790413_03121 [Deinococcus hopiensis KR-140]